MNNSYQAKSSPPTARRIVHMVNSFEMGGSEHQMVEVARRQCAQGHRVVVGCLANRGPLMEIVRQAGIPVFEFDPGGGLFTARGFYQLLRLARFLRRERPDIFQAHELYSTLLGVPAAWLAQVPTVISSRRNLGYWWWYTHGRKKVLRWIENLSAVIIANSNGVRDFLVNEEGISPSRICVVRNAVDVQKFTDVPSMRTDLFPHLGDSDRLIVTVANMNTESKGHADLVSAAAEVCRVLPQARFLLVGDGCERPGIEQAVRASNLESNVLFLGKRNDVPAILRCCNLYLSSSRSEG